MQIWVAVKKSIEVYIMTNMQDNFVNRSFCNVLLLNAWLKMSVILSARNLTSLAFGERNVLSQNWHKWFLIWSESSFQSSPMIGNINEI